MKNNQVYQISELEEMALTAAQAYCIIKGWDIDMEHVHIYLDAKQENGEVVVDNVTGNWRKSGPVDREFGAPAVVIEGMVYWEKDHPTTKALRGEASLPHCPAAPRDPFQRVMALK